MISFDTNILLYALNSDCPEFDRARDTIDRHSSSTEVVLSELVLVELYLLLRNPAVLTQPYSASSAAETVQMFRANPKWSLVENAAVMNEVWRFAARRDVARRRIIDARLALTLRQHGVTTFVTRNVRDFDGFGFKNVLNPFESS